jgi:hypothetical protein
MKASPVMHYWYEKWCSFIHNHEGVEYGADVGAMDIVCNQIFFILLNKFSMAANQFMFISTSKTLQCIPTSVQQSR